MEGERSKPRRSWRVAVTITLIAVIAAAVAIEVTMTGSRPAPPLCRVAVGSTTYTLDTEQAAHATTIAAVGKRLAMPDHAVTVGLAAALQESGLHNLSRGDRDSVGLFQQRPSQGWGTRSELMTPHYAAAAFFRRLALVAGWQNLSVTDAAQEVQHSGSPNAYARWESEARALAEATTGEAAAGLTCRFRVPHTPSVNGALEHRMAQELGVVSLGNALPSARGWTVATWLVGHALEFRISSVVFSGRRWTPSVGAWARDAPIDARVQIRRTAPLPDGTSTTSAASST